MIRNSKYLWLFFVVLLSSCDRNNRPIINTSFDGTYHIKTIQFLDKVGYKKIQYYDSAGSCVLDYETVNDTIDGRRYYFDPQKKMKEVSYYEKGFKHGVMRRVFLDRNESFEYLYLRDTVQLVKQLAQSSSHELCYSVYNIENGEELGDIWSRYKLKNGEYVNLFNLNKESIDWSKSSGYCDNLSDTLTLNQEISFSLVVEFNSDVFDGHKCLGSEFILFDSSIYPSKDNGVLCETKTSPNSNIILNKIKITNSKTRLLTGIISSAFFHEEISDTVYIHNTYYKQIYVK